LNKIIESEEVLEKIRDFISLSTDEAREKYDLRKDVRDWKVHLAQEDVRDSGLDPRKLVHILYRPFDKRFTYYTGKTRGLICMPRPEVMRNMLKIKNIGLSTTRSIEIGRGWEHVFCSSQIIQHHTVSLKEVNYLFPLYVYPKKIDKTELLLSNSSWPIDQDGRIPNLSSDFISDIEEHIPLKFASNEQGDLEVTFGPEDVFHYIYAILHSPTYRIRYADSLKRDFPKVPLTSRLDLFRKLCAMGEELVALHLLESPQLTQLITRYPEAGDNFVEKGFPKFVAYEEGQPGYAYINKTQYFEGVPKEVWEFRIGGYQVCEKWLKDRRGRKLSYEDLTHYQKVVVALKETIRLMEEIDKAIPEWPIK
jgi:predicted helicase